MSNRLDASQIELSFQIDNLIETSKNVPAKVFEAVLELKDFVEKKKENNNELKEKLKQLIQEAIREEGQPEQDFASDNNAIQKI